MQIETLPINTLKPSVYNPRIMPEDEMRKLGKSLAEFGVVEPIVINKNNNIIGGHMRIEALKTAGITEVPCVRVDIDPIKEKALNLALNKIHGEFEMPMLKDVLEEIDTGELEDIEITGFDEKIFQMSKGVVFGPSRSTRSPASVRKKSLIMSHNFMEAL